MEEIAKVSAALAPRIAASTLIAKAIMLGGTDKQKVRYLHKLSSGETIPAFSLTEPNAGSNAFALSASATLEGGEWFINGTKSPASALTSWTSTGASRTR